MTKKKVMWGYICYNFKYKTVHIDAYGYNTNAFNISMSIRSNKKTPPLKVLFMNRKHYVL